MLESPKRKNIPVNFKTYEDEGLDNEKFIFYNEKKFLPKLELEINLNKSQGEKTILLIDKYITIKLLASKIAEYMENFPTYSNLEGLRAVNITKKTEKGNILLPLENSGIIEKFLDNQDEIYFDLEAEEYWIQMALNLNSNYKYIGVNLDVKVPKEMKLLVLKQLILKTALSFWSDFSKEDDKHYLVKMGKCYTLKSKLNFEFFIENLNNSDENDQLTIGEIFEFNSKITLDLTLISIEELIFEHFKTLRNSDKITNKSKFEAMSQSNFEDFCKNAKYTEEYRLIKNLVNKFLSMECEDGKKRFYIYEKGSLINSKLDSSIDSTESNHSNVVLVIPKISTNLRKKKSNNDFIIKGEIIENSNFVIKQPNFENERAISYQDSMYFHKKSISSDAKSFDNENLVLKFQRKEKKRNTFNTESPGKSKEENNIFSSIPKEIDPDFQTIYNKKLHDSANPIKSKESSNKDLVYSEKLTKKIRSHVFQNLNFLNRKSQRSVIKDLEILISLEKVNELVFSQVLIKVSKLNLEKIMMPQFRNVRIKDETSLIFKSRKDLPQISKRIQKIKKNKLAIFLGILFVLVAIFLVLYFTILRNKF